MLTESQIHAIKTKRVLGKRLSRVKPEIAEDYRAGLSAMKIAEKYIPEQVSIDVQVACGIVYSSLEILLGEEKKDLAKEHLSVSGVTQGRINKSEKRGIFSLSAKENRENFLKGFRSMGKVLYDSVRTTELGEIKEIDYIIELRKNGASYQEITDRINTIYKNNRKVNSVRNYLSLLRKYRSDIPKLNSLERKNIAMQLTMRAGNILYTGNLQPTEFGLIDEITYISNLRSKNLPWSEITQKTNEIYKNNRSKIIVPKIYRAHKKAIFI